MSPTGAAAVVVNSRAFAPIAFTIRSTDRWLGAYSQKLANVDRAFANASWAHNRVTAITVPRLNPPHKPRIDGSIACYTTRPNRVPIFVDA